MKKVAVVTITRNNGEYLLKFLNAFTKNTTYPYVKLILIDNASTGADRDDILRLIKNTRVGDFCDFKLHRNEGMKSFAANCNLGVNLSREVDYVCFTNDDTEPQLNWLTELVKGIESKKGIAISSPKMYFPTNIIQHAGIAFRRTPHPHPGHIWWNKKHKDDPELNEPREFQAVTGGCMLVEKKVFEEVNGFDEAYEYAGYEDCDFCLKVRAKNYKILYWPQAELIHHEKRTQNRFSQQLRDSYFFKNHTRFFKKWFDKIEFDYHKFEPGVM